jgi:hypothetical protein
MVSKGNRRMTEVGLGGNTSRDNVHNLCSSVEIVQDELGNLLHLPNNNMMSPNNNSVVLV